MKVSYVAIGALLAAVAGFALGHFTGGGSQAEGDATAQGEVSGPPDGQQYRVIAGRSPQRGPDDALITIIEFVDYETPAVAETQSTLAAVLKKYDKKVRLLVRQNPDAAHKNAMGAAEAALAAHAQNKFWKMHRLLLQNQGELARPKLEALAKTAGLDLAQFKRELDEHTHSRMIESDMRTASRFGIKGAPMFFVNGYPLAGAKDVQAFSRLVDRELPKARQILATGVPGERLYAHMLRSARRSLNDEGTGPPGNPEGIRQPELTEDPNAVYKVAIDGAPVRGPANALVTIVEWTDFQ